jgi:hypothetical protein
MDSLGSRVHILLNRKSPKMQDLKPLGPRERPFDGSPLSFLTEEPELNQLIGYLKRRSLATLENPEKEQCLVFSRGALDRVRQVFATTILRGEAKLRHLSRLLAHSILGSEFDISSSVIGKLPSTGQRFTLARSITSDELMSSTDLDFGTRELERLLLKDGVGWTQAELVANFVHYEGLTPNKFEAFKLISRIKAEQAIWNKVVDNIFDFDSLVQADKQLRHLSPFVKDVFGLKFLTSDETSAATLQNHLVDRTWTEEELGLVSAPFMVSTESLHILEVKDYLRGDGAKRSGWKALKSVVRWWDQTFEIQVQPLANYYKERERFTRESHQGFKARREQLRERVAQEVPLFGFYHRLLKWLFLDPKGEPPAFPGLQISLEP